MESTRVRAYLHFTLGGEASVEEEEVLAREVERIACRWCGSTEVVPEAPPGRPVREGGQDPPGVPREPGERE